MYILLIESKKQAEQVYTCICTKSKARQSCAAAVIFAGVPTLPSELLNATFKGCITRPFDLIVSVIEKLLLPDGDYLVSRLNLLMVTTISQSPSFLKHRTAKMLIPGCYSGS